jgi:hypothetical protein
MVKEGYGTGDSLHNSRLFDIHIHVREPDASVRSFIASPTVVLVKLDRQRSFEL